MAAFALKYYKILKIVLFCCKMKLELCDKGNFKTNCQLQGGFCFETLRQKENYFVFVTNCFGILQLNCNFSISVAKSSRNFATELQFENKLCII